MIKTHCISARVEIHILSKDGCTSVSHPACFYGVTFRHMGKKETSYVLSNVV